MTHFQAIIGIIGGCLAICSFVLGMAYRILKRLWTIDNAIADGIKSDAEVKDRLAVILGEVTRTTNSHETRLTVLETRDAIRDKKARRNRELRSRE